MEKKEVPISEISAEQIIILGWPRTMKALFPGKGMHFVLEDKAVRVG